MTDNGFVENEERQALRASVAAMAANYGQDYYLEKARAGGDRVAHRSAQSAHRTGHGCHKRAGLVRRIRLSKAWDRSQLY